MTHPTDALRLVPIDLLETVEGLLWLEGYEIEAQRLNDLAAALASPLPEGGGERCLMPVDMQIESILHDLIQEVVAAQRGARAKGRARQCCARGAAKNALLNLIPAAPTGAK